jgi:hypothetical protein
MFDRSEHSFLLSLFLFCHTHGAYTQTRMSYLITELSPHIPLLAVATLALVFVVNSVWFSTTVTVTYYLFDFFGLSAPAPSPNTYPFPFTSWLFSTL